MLAEYVWHRPADHGTVWMQPQRWRLFLQGLPPSYRTQCRRPQRDLPRGCLCGRACVCRSAMLLVLIWARSLHNGCARGRHRRVGCVAWRTGARRARSRIEVASRRARGLGHRHARIGVDEGVNGEREPSRWGTLAAGGGSAGAGSSAPRDHSAAARTATPQRASCVPQRACAATQFSLPLRSAEAPHDECGRVSRGAPTAQPRAHTIQANTYKMKVVNHNGIIVYKLFIWRTGFR